jgi:hypothetical protein
MKDTEEVILERAAIGGVVLTTVQQQEYLGMEHDLGEVEKGVTLYPGYKRCGRCSRAKKYFLFNKNNGSKTNTSGNCKDCQKSTAKTSYTKTKGKRNYKKYYQENKEAKQAAARKYYEENKEAMTAKHKEYVQSKKGQKVMAKAHAKRRKSLADNSGVPYTRALVIHRDSAFLGLERPVCYLCTKPIEDITGKGLHLDHVVPVLLGGLDCFTNIASSHALCNLKREKDARELLPEQIEGIKDVAAKYIDAHPDKFGE